MRLLRNYIFVIAIVAVGWTLWVQRIGINDYDDAVSNELLFAAHSVATIVTSNPWPDQSPLYFLVLHAVRRFGESPFAIRVLNAAVLTVTLLASFQLALVLSESLAVALGTVLAGAVSPASVWIVREGRMYSIQMLLSVLAILALAAYRERHRTRDLITFVVLCVLNIYNHFLGVLITALLFVPLAVDGVAVARSSSGPGRRRRLTAALLGAVAVILLVCPQLLRLRALVHHGAPLHPGLSLPTFSMAFVDAVATFWFVNTDWGSLRGVGPTLPAIYFGCIALLTIVGITVMPQRHRFVVMGGIVVPLVFLGLLASRMDVRERYFAWILPLLWISLAAGAVGPLRSQRAAADTLRGFTGALAVTVVATSIALALNKLPERYAQWTKLMTGLQRTYRPSMVVYMPPGPSMGTPRFIARHLSAGLADIQRLDTDTHEQFVEQVSQNREFVFLVQSPFENQELGWREHYLAEQGFDRGVLPVWGARADIFTRRVLDGFSRQEHIGANPSNADMVRWARGRLQAKPVTQNATNPRVADGLVARIDHDGTVHEGILFISQRGEDGSWRLSANEQDGIDEVTAASGGIKRSVIAMHPDTNSVLLIAFPNVEMQASVRLIYGKLDSRLPFVAGAGARIALYVNGAWMGDADTWDSTAWHELIADTHPGERKRGDVVLLIAADSEADIELGIQLTSSRLGAPTFTSRAAANRADPVVLTSPHTLKDNVDRITVYRLAGNKRTNPRHEVGTHSAAEMHETDGPDGEGAVRTHWVLGPLAWDAVGMTRQQSGGLTREGLWAHPKNGTTLVIEVPNALLGRVVRGYVGLTDLAVSRATALKITDPVRLRMSIDSRPAVDIAVSRSKGWHTLESPVNALPGLHKVRIDIDSAADSWAHFVFDLWTE